MDEKKITRTERWSTYYQKFFLRNASRIIVLSAKKSKMEPKQRVEI